VTWWQAVILGIVEGLTEYLPISSTGHLLVVQELLGIGTGSPSAREAADAYAICIQAGAIVAVLGLYFGRVRQMAAGLAGRDLAGRKLVLNLLAGFLPAAVIGLLGKDWVKAHLFGPWPIVAAWFSGGLAILLVAYGPWQRSEGARRGWSLDDLGWRMALVVGVAQCIAMWPGVSRSLITIVGGVLVGLSLPAAVEFSFLLGVVTLGAATLWDAREHGALMVQEYGLATMAMGFAAAFVSAMLAVEWMVAYLHRHGLGLFGWYRLAAAAALAGLLLAGVVTARA